MKKRIYRFVFAPAVFLLVCLLFSACGKEKTLISDMTAHEIAEAVMAAYLDNIPDEIPETKLFYGDAADRAAGHLDQKYWGILVDALYQDVPEMKFVEDFAFIIPLGHYVFEINIIKVDDVSNMNAVYEMLQRRLIQKDTYDMHLYLPNEAELLAQAEIWMRDNYIFLVSTPDNTIARRVLTGFFDGRPYSPPTPTRVPVVLIEEDDTDAVKIAKSYEQIDRSILSVSAIKELPETELTAVPIIKVNKHSRERMYLVGGTCEVGAVIHATGGVSDITVNSDDGDFLIEIPIHESYISVIRLCAETPGKEASNEITLFVRPSETTWFYEQYGDRATIVGNEYFSFSEACLPDFLGANLLNQSEEAAVKQNIERQYRSLKNAGVNAEIIYLIAPNPTSVYKELVPEKYVYSESSLLSQFKRAASSAGAVVIDLSDVMAEHKNDEYKIYHKTDSHWTEYGAYLGYQELMTHIAKKFPNAAPRNSSDFTPYNDKLYMGDYATTLEIQAFALRETTSYVEFNFDPPNGYIDIRTHEGNGIAIDHWIIWQEHTTETNQSGDFPSAYILRDSYAGPMYSFLTDRFSSAYWNWLESYYFDAEAIAAANPDYVIYIITERNLRNVLLN